MRVGPRRRCKGAYECAESWRTRTRKRSQGRFAVLASGDGADVSAGALKIDAYARLLGATLRAGQSPAYPLSRRTMAYLVPTMGCIRAENVDLAHGYGVAIADEVALTVTAIDNTSIVTIELLSDPDSSG
ncbi:hypothetical protein [Caballeronia sp. J97]|uniref:pirin family protein n=1 Tax=Caballeronia sp. J97 TaxID=2805429 RepID=UPI002AB2B213|nr:hypothetical protein [Caballeronia sp. J97]